MARTLEPIGEPTKEGSVASEPGHNKQGGSHEANTKDSACSVSWRILRIPRIEGGGPRSHSLPLLPPKPFARGVGGTAPGTETTLSPVRHVACRKMPSKCLPAPHGSLPQHPSPSPSAPCSYLRMGPVQTRGLLPGSCEPLILRTQRSSFHGWPVNQDGLQAGCEAPLHFSQDKRTHVGRCHSSQPLS